LKFVSPNIFYLIESLEIGILSGIVLLELYKVSFKIPSNVVLSFENILISSAPFYTTARFISL